MVSLIVIVPLLDIGIACLYHPPPAILFGLVLLATTPGGVLSNVLTDLAKGNVALSVSLSIGVSALYVVIVPFIVTLAQTIIFSQAMPVSVSSLGLLGDIVLITVLPVSCGMLVGGYLPASCKRLLNPVKLACTATLLVLYAVLLYHQRAALQAGIRQIAWAVLGMNCVNPLWGWLVCRLGRVSHRDTVPIVFEHLIRQEGTAIFIAVALLHREESALPLIMNSLFSIIIGSGIMRYFRSRG
ncbi:sodium-dependent transporter [Komagataeibacter xylinus NBRC 15237]|nr:sodium-dependent transporter [Komagataeibacter xylinus NBRC 15237]